MTGNIRLTIGGFDGSYMERLAIYVKRYFGDRLEVSIDTAGGDVRYGNVFFGSREYIKSVSPDRGIVLFENDCTPEIDLPCIYRYMPAQAICRELSRALDSFGCGTQTVRTGKRPEWIAITGDGPAWELEAFAVTSSYVLGEKKRVLYVDFVPFGGTAGMLGTDIREDVSDLVMALRSGGNVSLCGYTLDMDGFRMIPGMHNPSNLYELSTDDARLVLESTASENAFDTMVFAAGVLTPGTEYLLTKANRCIHITGRGWGRGLSRDEWEKVYGMIRKENKNKAEIYEAPEFSEEEGKTRAVREWADGAPGEMIREIL